MAKSSLVQGGTRVSYKPRVDTLRAIACILLVAYHVIGYTPETGMRVPHGSWLRSANDALAYVRMPLFAFVGGVVYAVRPARRGELGIFLNGKMKRLLIPLLCVGSLSILMQDVLSGTPGRVMAYHLSQLPLYAFAHLWFLQAFFVIFVVVALLERFELISSARQALIAFVISIVPFTFCDSYLPHLFSIHRAAFLFPFFLAGLIISRFSPYVHQISSTYLVLIVITAALPALSKLLGDGLMIRPAMQLFVGIATAGILLRFVGEVPFLAWLGTYSYSIYLWHIFGTAGSRMLLQKVGIVRWDVVFATGLIAGLLFPILLHRLLQNVPFLSRALLGLRPRVPT